MLSLKILKNNLMKYCHPPKVLVRIIRKLRIQELIRVLHMPYSQSVRGRMRIKTYMSLGVVAHACNCSYLGGRGRRIRIPDLPRQNLGDAMKNKLKAKRGQEGVAEHLPTKHKALSTGGKKQTKTMAMHLSPKSRI
jgi:hypothetical protein